MTTPEAKEKPVGNQRAAKKASSRADILAAATACIACAGVEAATMEEIAAKAGVSKSLVLYHFETKDDLLAAVESELFEKILCRIRSVRLELDASPERAMWALDDLWKELLESATLVPMFVHLGFRALNETDRSSAFNSFIERHRVMLREGAESVLGTSLDRLGLSTDSVVDLLLSVIAGLAMQSAFTGDQQRATRSFEDFKRIVTLLIAQTQNNWAPKGGARRVTAGVRR